MTAPAAANPTNVFPIDLVVTWNEKVTGFGDTGIPELAITGGSFILTTFYAASEASIQGKVYYLQVRRCRLTLSNPP